MRADQKAAPREQLFEYGKEQGKDLHLKREIDSSLIWSPSETKSGQHI